MASFRIGLDGADGFRDFLIYETDPASLSYPDGTPVDLTSLGKHYFSYVWPVVEAFSPDNPIGKTRKIRRLKIQLGLGCNYSCSYCSQGNQRGSEASTSTADAHKFITQLDQWISGHPDKIELWGGEPLLYWKKIEILAPALRAKFPQAKILIITNGTLMDFDKIEFIKAHQISVAVSHDGPGQHLRGPDPFDNLAQSISIRHLFRSIGQNASFNSVMTAENTDIKAVIDFFTDKMGRQVKVNVEDPVSAYEGMQNYCFTPDQHKKLAQDVIARITDGTALAVPSVVNKLEMFFNSIAWNKPQSSAGQLCGMDAEDFITVDLDGNVLTCQNTGAKDHKIGHVEDFDNISLDTSYHFSTRPNCSGCPVVHLCYGSCMFLTGKEFNVSCDNAYHYNLAVICGALELLLGRKVTGINYRKPNVVMPIKVIHG